MPLSRRWVALLALISIVAHAAIVVVHAGMRAGTPRGGFAAAHAGDAFTRAVMASMCGPSLRGETGEEQPAEDSPGQWPPCPICATAQLAGVIPGSTTSLPVLWTEPVAYAGHPAPAPSADDSHERPPVRGPPPAA